MQELLEGFRNPPNECRPMPFWFWNSRLDQEEIISQIKAFSRMGLGGFFIHARFGLETPYLSDDWLDAVEAAVRAAETVGLDVWLYDENLFPSGIGNTVVSRELSFRPKFIEYDVLQPSQDAEGYFIPLDALPEGCEPFSVQVVSDEAQRILPFCTRQGKVYIDVKDGQAVTLFWINTIHDRNDLVFGVDYLNPDTVNAFIESTHEVYRKKLGGWFGTVIKGFFTDEPTLLPWHHDISWYKSRGNGRCVPFTYRLLEEMERDGALGIDLGRLATALFFDCGSPEMTGRIRKAYWKTVSRLYEENFFKAYAAWCEKHSLMLTGHVLLEEGLYFNHIFQAGPLSGLKHMHMPGVDQLSAVAESTSMSYMVEDLPHIPRVRTNVTGPKLVSSNAHLAGKRKVISESYGVGGWGMQYFRMKAILDWLYALGVNRLCPHAFFYSIEGFRKNDAPPCHYHNPDAAEYRLFADYAARLSWAMSQGEPAADTAVLYPESAFRGCYAVGRQREQDRIISDAYDLACVGLLGIHRNYEIITEGRLASAELVNGELALSEPGEKSSIGVACGTAGIRFSTVIVPSQTGMDHGTEALLMKFAASGGRLVVFNAGSDSVFTSCGKSVLAVQTYPGMTRQEIQRTLLDCFGGECSGGLKLSGRGGDKVYALCRKIGTEQLWLLANTDAEKPFHGRVSFGGRSVSSLDPETGGVSADIGGEAELSLAPAGSALLLVSCRAGVPPRMNPRRNEYCGEFEIVPDWWEFRTDGLNALPVDHWDLTMKRSGMTVEYIYRAVVHSEISTDGELYVVLDDVAFRSSTMGINQLCVTINGCTCEPAGWHIDRGFRKFRADGLKSGRNLLEITIRAKAWSGEPHMLTGGAVVLGHFGLEKHGQGWRVVSEPGKMHFSPWDGQGYPFYSGRASYTKRIVLPANDSLFLELGGVEGCARLSADGVDLGARLWPPWRWQIPSGMAGKEIELRLDVTNTLANYLGDKCKSGPCGRMRLLRSI